MSTCSIISFKEAIDIWISGNKLDNYCIYSVNMVWLGRIAKVTAYISALPIIIDLIGEKRVRSFGNSTLEKFVNFLEKEKYEGKIGVISWIIRNSFLIGLVIVCISAILYYAILFLMIFYEKASGNSLWSQKIYVNYFFELVSIYIAAPLWIGLIFTLLLPQYLSNKKFAHHVRMLAFVLLGISFAFDMLAS